ncbi:MAG: YrbL family protein [Paracoccaceae bacterium]
MLEKFIDLSDQKPLAQGQTQFVYQHPEVPGILVKTMKPRSPRRQSLRYSAWRYGKYRLWHREYSEYISLLARTGGHFDRLPRYYGFCETSNGPGFLTEYLKGPDGGLAPILRKVLDNARDKDHLLALRMDVEALTNELSTNNVVFGDLTSKNLVVVGPDQDRLKMVDGLGTYTLIPIKQFSRYANNNSISRWRRNLLGDVDEVIKALDAN